jgi:hypothetical protein
MALAWRKYRKIVFRNTCNGFAISPELSRLLRSSIARAGWALEEK